MVKIENMKGYEIARIKEAETVSEGIEMFCSGIFSLVKQGNKGDGVFFARPLEVNGKEARKTIMFKAVVVKR
jgi:hypothetical protein